MSSPRRIIRSRDIEGRIRIELPASKSISNRLLIMRVLSRGTVAVDGLSTADDTQLLDTALRNHGGNLWLGHAGTALRFGLAWAAISPGERILAGSERLSERPIAPLVDALRSLGADISYAGKEGFAPLRVNGKALRGGRLQLDASMSSQFITALMLIGPYLIGGLTLELIGRTVSAPYLHMTAGLMEQAGVSVEMKGSLIVVPEQPYAACAIEVEPDWSAASYFYSLVALNPRLEVLLAGLKQQSLQGDAALVQLFRRFGVYTHFTANGAVLTAGEIIDDSERIDFLECPDLAQTMAVTAAGLQIPMVLTGLQTLRVKETDRIAALAAELAKCGVESEAGSDYLRLMAFGEPPSGQEVSYHMPSIATYHDHRMAMAFAPLALALGEIAIEDPDVVSKSFPEFWKELAKVMEILEVR